MGALRPHILGARSLQSLTSPGARSKNPEPLRRSPRRPQLLSFGALSAALLVAPLSARAGLTEDLLAKSAANKVSAPPSRCAPRLAGAPPGADCAPDKTGSTTPPTPLAAGAAPPPPAPRRASPRPQELNNKKRLATSGANFARSRTVTDGTCSFPKNWFGCENLAETGNVKVRRPIPLLPAVFGGGGGTAAARQCAAWSRPGYRLRALAVLPAPHGLRRCLSVTAALFPFPFQFLTDDIKLECEGNTKEICAAKNPGSFPSFMGV